MLDAPAKVNRHMAQGIELVDRETLFAKTLQMAGRFVEHNVILLEGNLQR